MQLTRVLAGIVVAAAWIAGVVFCLRAAYFSWIAKRGAPLGGLRKAFRRPSWDDYDPQLAFQAFRKCCLSMMGFLICLILVAVVGRLFLS